MVDRLPCIGARVHYKTESTLIDGEVFCELLGDENHVPNEFVVGFLQGGDAGDVLLWDDEDVDGRLGMNVLERDDLLILIDDLAFDPLCGDFTEDAFLHC